MNNPNFEKLCQELVELHNKKNSGYGSNNDPYANFREAERLGIEPWRGILIRMGDKWSRLCNLANGVPDEVGESLIDTITDLAVYALLCRLMIEEKQKKVL